MRKWLIVFIFFKIMEEHIKSDLEKPPSHTQQESANFSDEMAQRVAYEHELAGSLNEIVRDSLSPVYLVLAGLYLLYAAGHLFSLRPPKSYIMFALAVTTAAAFFAVWTWAIRQPVPLQQAQRYGGLAAGFVLINGLAHLFLTGNAVQSTNLMLLIVGAGLLFLSYFWLTLVSVASWAGWFLAATLFANSGDWMHFGFAMLGATALSYIVHAARMKAYARMHKLRWQERSQQQQLAAALSAAEEAKQIAQAANKDFETAMRVARESEERLRRFVDAMVEGVVLHDNGKIIDANPAFAEMVGYKDPELIGMDMRLLISPEYHQLMAEVMQRRDEKMFKVVVVRKNGSTFPVEVRCKCISFLNRNIRAAILKELAQNE